MEATYFYLTIDHVEGEAGVVPGLGQSFFSAHGTPSPALDVLLHSSFYILFLYT